MQDSEKRVFPHAPGASLHKLFRGSPAQIVTDRKGGDEEDTFENEPRNGARISGVNGVHQVAHIERGIDGCRRGKQHHQHGIRKNAFFFTNIRIHENPLLPKTFRNAHAEVSSAKAFTDGRAAFCGAYDLFCIATFPPAYYAMRLYKHSILHNSQERKGNSLQR